MKNVFKWIAAIIFLFLAIGSFTEGGLGFIAGIFFLIAGLVCLPPSLASFEGRRGKKLPSSAKYILVVGCWILGAILLPKTTFTEKNIASTKSELQAGKENDKAISTLANVSAGEINNDAAEEAKTKEQLERELKSMEKPFDAETFSGSVTSAQMGVVLFATYKNIIRDAKATSNKEILDLATKLEKKVLARQAQAFPKLRKNYADAAAEKLWESNIYVTVSGANNSVLNMTGGLFASNKNIKQTQETIQEIATQFRFKEVRYRWYKGADEFTYYKLETPKDSEPVVVGE